MKAEKVLKGMNLETLPFEHQQLSFVKMQFGLCQQPANNRWYTSDFLINAMVASCWDLLKLNIEGVEYVEMGKANSDPTEHSLCKKRVMFGTNYWTSMQAFMMSNRLSQKLHLINVVCFLPQYIKEDLQLPRTGRRTRMHQFWLN